MAIKFREKGPSEPSGAQPPLLRLDGRLPVDGKDHVTSFWTIDGRPYTVFIHYDALLKLADVSSLLSEPIAVFKQFQDAVGRIASSKIGKRELQDSITVDITSADVTL